MKFCIDLDVTDVDELYMVAVNCALDEGLDQLHAEDLLKPCGQIDVRACLIMVLDPGVSPNGTQINQSYVE